MYQELIEKLAAHRVLLLGYGREGKSTLRFIRRHLPEQQIGIADANRMTAPDAHCKLHCGKDYLESMQDYDVIIKSPGIPFRDVSIPEGCLVTCQVDLFLRYAPATCIGVTGTKGKSTTATLIHQMLLHSGMAAELIGNMGLPVLDKMEEVDGKIAVMELSSHQLEFTTASPHIAVFTNLFPEHLDHYNGFSGYANAKLNIARYQRAQDYFIHGDKLNLSPFLERDRLPAKKIAVTSEIMDVSLRDAVAGNSRLRGTHFAQDVNFAQTAAAIAGATQQGILQAVRDYAGIAHRMEPVGTFRGITFVDDCIATIPDAVMHAVDALQPVDSLIFGGMDRGLDYSRFAKDLEQSAVRHLIAMPQTGHRIGQAMLDRGSKKEIHFVESMEEAIQTAYRDTAPGTTCLLSPAASSYNMYRDFEEKGDHFQKLVRTLGEE